MAETQLQVTVDPEAGVGWVRLDRPTKKNAMSAAMLGELISAFRSLRDDDRIGCIVTTGTGDAFSAGLDLHDLKAKWSRKRPWDEVGGLTELIRLVRASPKVTIAAVNGHCLGGGLALVNAHDIAVASERASFGMPEILRGSFGNVATASLFQTGIPPKKAFYLQLTGRTLSGGDAERLGLVSTVVPHEALEDAARELATHIASRSRVALEHAKIAAYLEMHQDFDTALRIDELVAHRMRVYADPLADVDGYLRSRSAEPGRDASDAS